MANRTISDSELLRIALHLLRTHGYHGVSVSQLAAATGLEKASLYYRFPGGKDDLVLAAVAFLTERLESELFQLLADRSIPVKKRIVLFVNRLSAFYEMGSLPCALDVLSLPGASAPVQSMLQNGAQSWLDALTGFARDCGHTSSRSREVAVESLAQIQGGLVLARAFGDGRHFTRSLRVATRLLSVSPVTCRPLLPASSSTRKGKSFRPSVSPTRSRA